MTSLWVFFKLKWSIYSRSNFLNILYHFQELELPALMSIFLKLSMSYRSLNTETTDIARRRYTRCNNGGVVNEVYHLKPYQILWKYLQKCERDDHQINQSAFWRLSCLLFESCFFVILMRMVVFWYIAVCLESFSQNVGRF